MTSRRPSPTHLLRSVRSAAVLVLGLLAVLLLSAVPAQAAPAGQPAAAPSPIQARYASSGGPSGPLGAAVTGETCGLVRSGCYQHFTGGSIYWSPTTDARIVTGPVRDRWAATGWENGLGYPTRDTFCGLRGGGCGQHFQFGSIYWSPATGAVRLSSVVLDRWAATGWENGPLGYPTTELFCGLRDGGCGQHFQGGSIYRTPAGGAFVVGTVTRDRWAATGWENGPLGYPTRDTFCGLRDNGCGQHFEGGSIYRSATTPATVVGLATRDRWAAQGWENGELGYPTRDTFCGLRDDGCGQHFQGGSVYRSASTPVVVVPAVFWDAWGAQGWENGRLGYPTGETFPYRGTLAQSFQGGTLNRLADGRVVGG
jgi:uncharacterized protein with LGFP repeats